MRQRAFEIALKPIASIRHADYNPRAFDEKRYALIKESLAKLGWLIPAYVADGVLLSGHQRMKAWEDLGGKEVPVVEVTGLSDSDKRGLNILFNLATNDFKRADLESQVAAHGRIRPAMKCDGPYPCMSWVMRSVQDLVKKYGVSYAEADGWQFTKSMLSKGLLIPIIVSLDGEIANGSKRLFAYAKQGVRQVPVVRSTLDAKHISWYVNKISMQFDLKRTYSTQMRYGSFRRLRLKREVLGHGFSAWIRMQQYPRCEMFDHNDPANILKLKKRFGKSIVDFGAGHLHETDMLRSIGIAVAPFEPYRVVDRDEPNLEASRELTREFLKAVASKRQFESVIISSVFNSVPFREDREKILQIAASLSPRVFVCTRATKDPQLLNAQGRTNFSENNFGYVNILANYEKNVILGEIISGAPKAQKFYQLDELKQIVGQFYEDVIGFESANNVYCHGSFPKKTNKGMLIEALKFEFNLPYPEGESLGMAEEAISAWRARGAL